MKSILLPCFAGLLAIGATTSCMTTYDAQGRPVQSVDPGAATAIALTAAAVGYAVGHDNDKHYYYQPYYRRPYYGRPYRCRY